MFLGEENLKMLDVRIPATKNTPEVILDPSGMIRISGRSIHENAADFWEPMLNWVDGYIETPSDITHIDISLEYFNSASAKYIVLLLQKVTYVTLKHSRFIINWFYEQGDDDILERGEYFASVLDVEFNFVEIAQ